MFDEVGKLVNVAPEIYTDAFKPAAQESGKTVALIPRAINAALVPLRQWIAQKEYNLAETEKMLAKKLEHVGEDKIVTPEPYVAVPAIQAISYAMNSEELRNLYANLLAKSMVLDTKNSVHPSFVEIIKQMSPTDATVFKIIMKAQLKPIINLKIMSSEFTSIPAQNNCSWIQEFPIEECAPSFDNLIRLGLIEANTAVYYNQEDIYDKVILNPLFQALESQLSAMLKGEDKLCHEKGLIKINDFSILFYNLCVVDP